MKKDVLLPIAAIALAPVSVYAAVSTEDVSKENAIASADGTLEYTLIPGTYTLSSKAARVSVTAGEGILADAVENVDADGTATFQVVKEGTITVTALADGASVSIVLANAQGQYEALANSVSEDQSVYLQLLAGIDQTTATGKAEYQARFAEYEAVTAQLKALKEEDSNVYSDWVEANTTTRDKISSDVQALTVNIEASKAKAIEAVQNQLKEAADYVQSQLTAIATTLKASSTGASTDATVTAGLAELSTAKANLTTEAGNESPSLSAVSLGDVDVTDLDAFKAQVDTKVTAINEAIKAADDANATAFETNKKNVQDAKDAYDAAIKELDEKLAPAENYPNLLPEAKAKLAEVSTKISATEADVLANEASAAEKKDGYETTLKGYITEIGTITNDYETIGAAHARNLAKVQDAKDAYSAAVKELKEKLTPEANYANLRATATKELTTVNGNIFTVQTAVKEAELEAVSKEEGFATELNGYISEINGIVSKYEARYAELEEGYKAAIQENVAPLSEELAGYKDSLGDKADEESTDSHNYSATISGITEDITALEDAITADLAKVSAIDETPEYAVSAQVDAIKAKLSDLSAAVAKAQSYDEAKATVSNLQSALDQLVEDLKVASEVDEAYVPYDYFSDQADAIQNKINTLSSNVEKDYADSDLATVTVTDNVTADITATSDDADSAKSTYEKFYGQVADLTEAIESVDFLDEFSGELTVGYAGGNTEKTYQQAYDELVASRDAYQEGLDGALAKKKNGADHKAALEAIKDNTSDDAALVASLTSENYAEDVAAYKGDAVINAAELSISEAKIQIENKKAELDAYKAAGSRGEYGNAWATESAEEGVIQKTLGELQEKLAKISADLENEFYVDGELNEEYVTENAATSLTTVNTIKAQLSELSADFDKLQEEADKATAAYADVLSTQKTLLTDLVKAENDLKAIDALSYTESQDVQNLADEKESITNDIAALKTKIDAAASAETIVADSKGEDGLSANVEALKQKVQDLSDSRDAWEQNDKGYQTVLAELDAKKIATAEGAAFVAAENAVTAAYGEDESVAKTYYEEKIANLKGETLTAILSDLAKQYADHELGNDETKNLLVNRVDGLAADLDKIVSNANANKTNYDALLAQLKALDAAWEDAFDAFNSTDESLVRDEQQEKLSSYQADIQDIYIALEEASKGNLSSTETTEYKNIEDAIKATSKDVAAIRDYYAEDTEGGYASVIRSENQAEFDKLEAAVKTARQDFTEDIKVLDKYLNQLDSKYAAGLIESHDKLYELYTGITDVYTAETATKLAADKDAKPYDATDAVVEVNRLAAEIGEKYESAKVEANDAFKATVQETLDNADADKTALKDEAVGAGFDEDIVDAAISAAFDADYNALKAALDDTELAINYGNYENLLSESSLEELNKTAKEKIASDRWTADYEEVQVLYGELSIKISSLPTKSSNVNVNDLISDFNELDIDGVKNEVEASSTWKSDIYADYSIATKVLDNLKQQIAGLESRYADLTQDIATSNTNLAALNTLYNTQRSTATNYSSTYGKYELTLFDVKSVINEYNEVAAGIKADYTKAANQGLLSDDEKASYEAKLTAAYDKVLAVKTSSTEDEYEALLDAINLLKSDYNNLSTEDKNANTALRDEIDAIDKAYGAVTDVSNPDAKLAVEVAPYTKESTNYQVYIDLEARISNERAELNASRVETVRAENVQLVSDKVDALRDLIANLSYEGTDLLSDDSKATADAEIASYKEQLGELKTDATDLQSAIESLSGGSLLVLADNKTLEKEIASLTAAYDELAAEIEGSKKPYAENKANYDAVQVTLEELRAALTEAREAVGDYAGKIIPRSSVAYYGLDDVEGTIDSNEAEVADLAGNLTLTSDYDVTVYGNGRGDLNIAQVIALYEKRYEQQVKDDAIDALKAGKYAEVEALIDPNEDYLNETYADLKAELDAIGVRINDAIAYIGAGDASNTYGNISYDYVSGNSTEFYGYYNDGYVTFAEAMAQADENYSAIDEDLDKLAKKIKANKYILGDINGDGEVGVSDFDLLKNIVLDGEYDEAPAEDSDEYLNFKRYNVNGDSQVDVADLQNVVAIVRGSFKGNVASAPKRVAATVQDAVSVTAEGSGVNQRLAVSLSSSRVYTGAQFDVRLPEGATLAGVQLTTRTAGLTAYTNEIRSGYYRVLIVSLDEVSIQGNEGAIANLELSVTPEYAGTGVTVENVVLTDASAQAYRVSVQGEATGIATVSTTEYVKEKVYSVGGQLLDGLKKGVNIIRGNDGSAKKVIRK